MFLSIAGVAISLGSTPHIRNLGPIVEVITLIVNENGERGNGSGILDLEATTTP